MRNKVKKDPPPCSDPLPNPNLKQMDEMEK